MASVRAWEGEVTGGINRIATIRATLTVTAWWWPEHVAGSGTQRSDNERASGNHHGHLDPGVFAGSGLGNPTAAAYDRPCLVRIVCNSWYCLYIR